ncbi:Flp/Fap pilin component [Aureimonas endophytica]|uniref:Flp/Fap pilin component n=1 Tax=Aureimonas endophytica TaxID=2027858 RepID=A0A917E7X6_9HYPH|nr:Flp family type IVb pilin [Aureimonas endophytica]GGE09603.1 Flp/Fap pilin component [Aureimonas endophytica]
MRKFFSRFARNESGATAIEYGLIAAFMAVCLIAALPKITAGVSSQFTSIGTKLSSGQ